MTRTKVIFHMDGDAFFVGCEVAKNPKLKGLPVVVGEERGIATALSYEAKALGVTRGMPIFKIKKEYPSVIILAGDYQSYADYSEKMFDIVRRYANDVEEYSIDECFADLTGLDWLKMTPFEIAKKIKKEVSEELGLSVSVGIAPTKVLAKVASKWVKPNGLTEITKETTLNFLAKFPIEKIWGIGPRTSEFLKKKGISMAGDFASKNIGWVRENLSKPYLDIWRELHGEYVMKINPELKTVYSSMQKTRTFHPATNDKVFLLSELSKHIEDACRKARHYKLVAKKFSFFLKLQSFKYVSYDVALSPPINTPETLISLVEKHFKEIYTKGVLYRTAGVTLHDLVSDTNLQMDLFGGSIKADKFKKIHEHVDKLQEKFGKRVVYMGSTHKSLKRKKIGTDSEDLDRDLLFL